MYTLYIGSNNETGVLEKEKAIEIISQYFDSFSCYEIDGYWKGKAENTLKVEIVTENSPNDTSMIDDLKRALKQESILMIEQLIKSNFI